MDVNLTLFLHPTEPQPVLEVQSDLGCRFDSSAAEKLIREHSFCRATLDGVAVDVFLPMFDLYELARERRRLVRLGSDGIMIWSAETLAVFKMMFFRGKDRVDVERLLRDGGSEFDRQWVRSRLVEIFGARDPRLPSWDELAAANP